MTIDTGHAALGGVDAVSLIRAHPRRVAHVHCKDIRGKVYSRIKAAGGSFLGGVLDGMFTVPAESGHRRPASLRGARFGNFAA